MALVRYQGRLIDSDDLPPGAQPDNIGSERQGAAPLTPGYTMPNLRLASPEASPADALSAAPFLAYSAPGIGDRSMSLANTYRGDAEQGMADENQRFADLYRKGLGEERGSWLNQENLAMFSSAATGIGGLAKAWSALKTVGLTKDAYANQNKQWQADYDAQKTTTNNRIKDQNAFKKAQGRTDYGNLVGMNVA